MSAQPRSFLYLDPSGIESLFAQTVDRIETELSQSTEKGVSRKGVAKFGLGAALAALLGLKVGTELESATASTKLEETKSTITVEHKLSRLRDYLARSGNLANDLAAGTAKAAELKTKVFIDVNEPFDAPQFIKGGGGTAQVNKDGAILFEIDRGFGSGKIVMAASLTKFPAAAGGKLNQLSHVALHFMGSGGKGMPLHVFGNTWSLGNGTFQIKPYSIW